jgi:hypothetical protein
MKSSKNYSDYLNDIIQYAHKAESLLDAQHHLIPAYGQAFDMKSVSRIHTSVHSRKSA